VQEVVYQQQIMKLFSTVLMIDEVEYIVVAPAEDGRIQGIPRFKAKINFESP
jgi:hypothetical protein